MPRKTSIDRLMQRKSNKQSRTRTITHTYLIGKRTSIGLAQIRNDFNDWMLNWFDLANSQMDQVRDGIATYLRDSWENGVQINF